LIFNTRGYINVECFGSMVNSFICDDDEACIFSFPSHSPDNMQSRRFT